MFPFTRQNRSKRKSVQTVAIAGPNPDATQQDVAPRRRRGGNQVLGVCDGVADLRLDRVNRVRFPAAGPNRNLGEFDGERLGKPFHRKSLAPVVA